MKKNILVGSTVIIFLLVIIPAAINWSGPKAVREETGEFKIVHLEVYLSGEGKVVKMDLEEYLVGVVAAEMPANFELEALKAQAVAARTYALRRINTMDPERHPQGIGAVVCDDSTHCQAWHSKVEQRRRWGLIKYSYYKGKIEGAVEETRGMVLVYDGQPADPVYHGSCGGVGTESSENVWKYAVPYLRETDCNWDDMDKFDLTDQIKIDAAIFGGLLATNTKNGQAIHQLLKAGEYSKRNRLKFLTINDEIIPASVVRSKLGLSSTVFSWQVKGDDVYLTTRGKGHGVGLCQYGATGMAEKGKTYQEILEFYYKGTKLEDIKEVIQ